jgi:hypothetical protein
MAVGATKNIVIHSAFIRNIILPQQLLLPIRERYIAVEMEKTAMAWEATKRSAAELQREDSLIEQRRREVDARTDALEKLIGAERTREVERIHARTRKLVAEKQMAIAELEASRTVTLGEADADVKRWMGEADATGFELKVAAVGDPASYTRYRLAEGLPDNVRVRVVHAGAGTLWTDLEKTTGAVGAGRILQGGQAEAGRTEPAEPAP